MLRATRSSSLFGEWIRQSDSWLESGRGFRCIHHFSSSKWNNRDNKNTTWSCHWWTTLKKQRQQVSFALFKVCICWPRWSTWWVNSRDYRQKLCRTLIDRAIMKKSCFPWADASCVITLLASGGHLTGLSGFLTAQRVCSGSDRGCVVVSNIVNQLPLFVSLLLPRPSSWNTLDNPKSDKECVSNVLAVSASLYLFPRTINRVWWRKGADLPHCAAPACRPGC